MIYDLPDKSSPIRQGDIFSRIPRLDIDLQQIPRLLDDYSVEVATLKDYATDEDPKPIILTPALCPAIVITQDCDNTRADSISLAQIFPLTELEKSPPSKAEKWASYITKKSRETLRLFYLPESPGHNELGERHFADFQTILRVRRVDLESLLDSRIARLNNVADEHFREQLSQYFRRYPYDEWYPLTKDELSEYRKKNRDAEPFPWQK